MLVSIYLNVKRSYACHASVFYSMIKDLYASNVRVL